MNNELKALQSVLADRVVEARKQSLKFRPNVLILVNNNEFIQMVGHGLLGGDFATPRYQGFKIKVLASD
jgi:hypothetical protein